VGFIELAPERYATVRGILAQTQGGADRRLRSWGNTILVRVARNPSSLGMVAARSVRQMQQMSIEMFAGIP
jgi:hypothetical protein